MGRNAPHFLIKGGADMQIKRSKKFLFLVGIVILAVGFSILSVFVYASAARCINKNYFGNALYLKYRH